MTQCKKHPNRPLSAPQGSSLAFAGLATLSLIGCVAVGSALIGVAHAQKDNPRTTMVSLSDLEWHDIADQREVFDEALNSER